MNKFIDFISKYSGAIIGAIVAILVLITGLLKAVAGIILIILGALFGNHIQKNKYDVKEKLKNFIDKM